MDRLYKKRSKGSSLVFVIIAIAFVGILGSILLNITMINIETKGIDRDVKRNFYKAETVMDKLNITLENISADAMKDAYKKMMMNYTNEVMTTTDQVVIQNTFAENYINNILATITDGVSLAKDSAEPKNRTLSGKYNPEKIKSKLESDFTELQNKDYLATDKDKAFLEVSFNGTVVDTEKYLLLKNMKVNYYENPDASDNDAEMNTWILTDIKFTVPVLRFEGGGTYPNFTEYSIIGDSEVATNTSANATVNGSLYAGYKGFNVNAFSKLAVKRKSANIITRGDVAVENMASLTLGEEKNLVNVYAKNYRTSGTTNAYGKDPSEVDNSIKASLNVYANSYIMDDLSLDAPYSDVYFGGDNSAYYGYMFNKDNGSDASSELDSNYSSAIIINGKHSSLEMDKNMSSILLGGRAFISRDKQVQAGIDSKNIMMGESVSIKSDQNFYLVDQSHMKKGCTNPMPWSDYEALPGDPGKTEVLSDEVTSRSSKIGKLLKSGTGQGVVPYVYGFGNKDINAAMVYFYYNFKSQSAADTFFNNYCNKEDVAKKIVSSKYLQFGENGISGKGISISPNIALFASGNYMTYSSENSKPGTYKNYNKTIGAGDDGKLKQESIDYATTYKALQLELSTKNKSKYGSTYDGTDGTNGFGMSKEELEGNQVFDSIMTKESTSTKHLFVEDAITKGTAAGYRDTGSYWLKSVPVEVDTKKVWAVFVVSPDETANVSLNSVLYDVKDGNGATANSFNRLNDVALVVANCDISADTSMRGLVISDNKVTVENSGTTLTAEPVLLRNMFRQQRTLEGSRPVTEKFITYFTEFSGLATGDASKSSTGNVDISKYITYSNWKKNHE